MRNKDLRNVAIPLDDWKRLRTEAIRLDTTPSKIINSLLHDYLHPEQPVSDQARQLSYDLAFDAGRAAQIREEEGQIRLPNGQVLGLPPDPLQSDPTAPGMPQEARQGEA